MIVDALVLVVILISAFISFFRGFVREALTIVGVVGGLTASYYGGPYLSPVFRDMLITDGSSPEKLFDLIPYSIIADALGYGIIFLVIVISLSIISYFISSALDNSLLGMIDRSLGIIFGIARGALILSLAYMPVHILLDQNTKSKYLSDSATIFYIEWGTDTIIGMLPDFNKKPDKIFDENTTRQALEENDILKPLDTLKKMDIELPVSNKDIKNIKKTLNDVVGEENVEKTTPANPAPAEAGSGYSDNQRDLMDQLIEEQANDE